MGYFVLKRLGQALVALLIMSVILFAMVFGMGDPIKVLADPSVPPELLAEYPRQLGLDRPFYEQYWIFLTNLLRGEFGVSYVTGRSALATILERFPATLELVAGGFVIAILVGVPLGVLAAVSRFRWIDRAVSAISIAGISLPVFWIRLMLVVEFSIRQRLLPAKFLRTAQRPAGGGDGGCHYARSDTFVHGRRSADHPAVARFAHLQRLQLLAGGQLLAELLSRACPCHRNRLCQPGE